MDEKNAELCAQLPRAAFDAQAPTYDTGTGESTRDALPALLAEVARAVEGGPARACC